MFVVVIVRVYNKTHPQRPPCLVDTPHRGHCRCTFCQRIHLYFTYVLSIGQEVQPQKENAELKKEAQQGEGDDTTQEPEKTAEEITEKPDKQE